MGGEESLDCHVVPSAVQGRTQVFRFGSVYNRTTDIHDKYGGQRYGGISTPSRANMIFLFTGTAGLQYGYNDGWSNDGSVFRYTGEGKVGNMSFRRSNNRAIKDQVSEGKDLLLFDKTNTGYKFLGYFDCVSWETGSGLDEKGNKRSTIIFHLRPSIDSQLLDLDVQHGHEDITALRTRAYSVVARSAGKSKSSKGVSTHYDRNAAIAEYVLARSAGICESCNASAPFLRKDGTPYLEPHHLTRLSDGGLDHPRNVGAVCPNCHREIHHGQDGEQKNELLKTIVHRLEDA